MKKQKLSLILSLACGLIFVYLFYKQRFGLNLIIFESLIISIAFIIIKPKARHFNILLIITGTLITMLAVFFYNNSFVVIVNLISFLILSVFISQPDIKSLAYASWILIDNIKLSIFNFFYMPANIFPDKPYINRFLRIALYSIIPVIIIFIFIILYSAGNSVFASYSNSLLKSISNFFETIFRKINLIQIILFVTGCIIAILFFLSKANNWIYELEQNLTDKLVRKKTKNNKNHNLKYSSLIYQYRSGVFLLISLNALIAFLNFLDIYWVWFNFKWDGGFLREFVHEGTYLLIFSILLSIVVVLYFFMGNLNYYSKNKLLLKLSYIWIIQNAIMTISVGIRNFWYIKYFNLAYLRIGVIAFLILTLYGLITVFIKIKSQKSSFYLLKRNSLAIYIILLMLSIVNWDFFISQYNITNSDKAYFHYDFMVTMPDRVLPVLLQNINHFDKTIDTKTSHEYIYDDYKITLDITNYQQLIEIKRQNFIKKYLLMDWQSWNYADYKAYKSAIK